MQRQSLGSPGREKPRPLSLTPNDVVSSSSSSLPSTSLSPTTKPKKHNNHNSHEKFIHVIPALVILCFLLLYLSSHDPSPNDMAEFRGYMNKHPEELIDATDIDEISEKFKGGVVEVLGMRSLRNLQEENININYNYINEREEITTTSLPKYRPHRKLADF